MSQGTAASFGAALAAGAAAALAVSISVAVAAPSLTDPLAPGLALVVLAPFVLGSLAGLLFSAFGRLLRRPRGRAYVAVSAAALAGAAPWLGVCLSATSQASWMGVVGALLALALGSFLVRLPAASTLVALLLAALPVAVAGPSGIEPASGAVKPVVLVGLDAATWDQIDPMFARGELPNLQALMEAGASGTLMSESPTLSPRIWTILATGVAPEDNGILAFQSSRSDLKAGRVWDAAASAGAKVGLMRWLMTWPPDPIPGFCVPGWLARGVETIPPEATFLKVLEKTGKGGGSLLSWKILRAGAAGMAVSSADNAWRNLRALGEIVVFGLGREDAYWRTKLVEARLSTDLYLSLMARERPGFSALILYPIDSLGHDYWRYHEPELFPQVTEREVELRGAVLREAYRECDRLLGEVLGRLEGSDLTVMVISDHGMESVSKESGEGAAKMTARIHTPRLLEALALEPGSLRHSVAGKQLILSPGLPEPDGTELLRRVHGILAAALVTESGEAPFRVPPFDAKTQTVAVSYRPEVLAGADLHVSVAGQSIPVAELFREEKRSGTHHDRGVILMRGPGVRAGGRIEEASIYDVAPTLLYAMGLTVPEQLAGKVLESAYLPQWLAEHPVERVEGGLPAPPEPLELLGDESLREAALQQLGYVDE